jgi:hypothetical protein
MRLRWVLFLLGIGALGAASWWLVLRKTPSPTLEKPPENLDPVWFTDVTDAYGLDFVHDVGDVKLFQQPQIHGSGVALFDFDGDGRTDIYLLNYGGPNSSSINRLYKNVSDGKGGCRFLDVTGGSGLGIAGYNTGVAIGDVNNDGKPDVLVTQFGGVKLFRNDGGGKFTDVTQQSELKNPLWGSSASFVDYDRDGWLDLVVVNYLEFDPNWVCHGPTTQRDYCGPLNFPATVSKLFRNRSGEEKSAKIRFEDRTIPAGFAKASGPGLGVYCADFDGDHWPDIFIANDARPNHLWINQKDGKFLEEAFLHGLAVDSAGQAQAGMGIAVGDVDGDGRFDVYVTHLVTERNTLWVQTSPKGQFSDQTAQFGLTRTTWRGTGFGTFMGDFDNDGWIDIAVANGRIARGSTTPNPALGEHFQQYSERNQLFRNKGNRQFQDVSEANAPFCGTPNVARGLACADLDGDGGLDMVITTVGNRARIFRNVAAQRGHWLRIRAVDPRFNRDAYGAEITVVGKNQKWLRHLNPGGSFQSSSEPAAHFGLGENTQFESIQVIWPDGVAETFAGGSADQLITLVRGKGNK